MRRYNVISLSNSPKLNTENLSSLTASLWKMWL